MLIRCNGCQKLFDYQQCKGRCPACGQRQNAPVSNAPLSVNTGSHKVRNAVLIVWALLLLAGLVGRQVSISRWERSGLLEGDVSISQVEYPEFSVRGRAAKVGPCEKLGSRYSTGLAAGHQLVRVKLEVAEAMDFESSISDTIFLQIVGEKGPEYYAPANKYELERVYPQLAEHALDDRCLSTYGDVDGYLYFVIPDTLNDPALYFELAHLNEHDWDDRHVEKALLCPLKSTDADLESEVADHE